jgi:hypothetical protein
LSATSVARSSAAAAEEEDEEDDDVAGCDWSVNDGTDDRDGTASDEVCFIEYLFFC